MGACLVFSPHPHRRGTRRGHNTASGRRLGFFSIMMRRFPSRLFGVPVARILAATNSDSFSSMMVLQTLTDPYLRRSLYRAQTHDGPNPPPSRGQPRGVLCGPGPGGRGQVWPVHPELHLRVRAPRRAPRLLRNLRLPRYVVLCSTWRVCKGTVQPSAGMSNRGVYNV